MSRNYAMGARYVGYCHGRAGARGELMGECFKDGYVLSMGGWRHFGGGGCHQERTMLMNCTVRPPQGARIHHLLQEPEAQATPGVNSLKAHS